MEPNIENENLDQNIAPETTHTEAVNTEAQPIVPEAEKEISQPTPAEIASAYLKENGIEFETLEDLKRVPEKVEVNPYEKYITEEDKNFFKYAEETGRGRAEFNALNANLDELPRIDLAREKVRLETGLKDLTNEQADEYLTDELNIDLEDMSQSDQIKLARFTKDILESKKAEQDKYRAPIENKQVDAEKPKSEYVRLDNGSMMLKSDYEGLVKNRQTEIENAKQAVNSVTASSFEVAFDDNGTERKETYTYEFDDKDKHSMVSTVSDINGVIEKEYGSGKDYNHKQFGEDMFWRSQKNREKAIASIVHKAVAKNTEEILKRRGNVNYNADQPIQYQNNGGTKTVSIADAARGNI